MVERSFALCLWIVASLYEVRSSGGSEYKTWTADTNFANPRNWDSGQLPCANDRVIFPASSPVVTFMPGDFSLAEMILPRDGQLIFPENGAMTITGGKSNTACPSKDAYFTVYTDFWSNPLNWNMTSSRALPNLLLRKNAAVPHAFQVPCHTDGVVFPPGTSFKSHIDVQPTIVASLKINGKSYANEELQFLLTSQTGKLLFPNNPAIHITGTECNERSGCVCGNDRPPVLSVICGHFVHCPPVECVDPVTPVGHCCPMCGARIVMKYETTFSMDQLIDLHRTFLDRSQYRGIESFTSKTYQEEIQSVFVDGSRTRGTANEAADAIFEILIKDIGLAKWYKLQSVHIYKSVRWGAGDNKQQMLTSNGLSSSGIAAVVIIIIGVAGAVLAYYIYRKRYVPGFSFARFDLYSGKIELEMGTTPHDELDPEDLPTLASTGGKEKAFDNPIYGSGASSTILPEPEESVEEKNYVENPMFMIFESSEDQEKT